MNIKIAGGIIGAAVLTAITGISFYLAHFTVYGKRQSLKEAFRWQKDHYDVSWYDDLKKSEYTIRSYDGYELHVLELEKPGESERSFVIISHGYTDNRFGSLKYAKMYLDMGFHVILYDLRGHGENAPAYCSYGLREGKDLNCLVEDTYQRYGKDILLGLHGESLGSATTVYSLRYQQKAAFAVADCGFADIWNVLEGGLRGFHLPRWFLNLASAAAKIRYGFSFRQPRPIDALAENKIPILFLHGADDNFILPSNSERMQKAAAGYSEYHVVPGAAHAEAVLKDPELYREYVTNFLKKTGVLQ